ncbi:tetratricopeptide repeat protein [Paracoccaceae bacterium]|nr:tetratricopeptide repeat protein [Paracoccaceae bacterium]
MTEPINRLLRKAGKYENEGKSGQAEDIYKNILFRFPKNKKALLALKRLRTPPQESITRLINLYKSGKSEETVIFGQHLADQFPNAPLLYEVIGAAFLSLENNDAAVANYQNVLRLDPQNTDARNNIGMVAYKNGDFDAAVEQYQKTTQLEPGFADGHYNLGNALRKKNNLSQAIKSFKNAIKIKPYDTEILTNYGHTLQTYGAFLEATEYYKKALKINPNLAKISTLIDSALTKKNELDSGLAILLKSRKIAPNSAEAIFTEGGLYESSGYLEAAVNYYQKTILLEPSHDKAFYNSGKILCQKKEYREAIKNLEQSIKINPDRAETYLVLGTAQLEDGQLNSALKSCEIALKINPECAKLFQLLGSVQTKQGNLDAALKSFQQSVLIEPNYAAAFNNIGVTQYNLGNLTASIDSHSQAVKLEPDSSQYHQNLAAMLRYNGNLGSALRSYTRALEISPDDSDVAWNQSLSYLANEDFKTGWPQFEARWRIVKALKPITTQKRLWRPGNKQRVLVWAEQGIGDEIMFASVIIEIYAMCSKLIVQIDARLIPLFKRSFPADIDFRPRSMHVAATEYDSHIPMGSLPTFFRQNIESFKSTSSGWLTASEKKSTNLRKKLVEDESESLIGISWHSTIPRISAENKVISLAKLAEKLHGPKVKLVNLQYGDVTKELNDLQEQRNINVIQVDEIDNKNDIDGLASLITACDRVVSISNLTIHLAGALGKKADVLLAFASDWRWGKRQDTTYWYDSVTLRRQTKINDWDTSIEKL